MIYDIGRVCVKIAGRDAGKQCVVIEQIDDKYVLVDGQTRRRKCNVAHLEPTKKTLDVKSGSDHDAIVKAFDGIGIKIATIKAKETPSRLKKAHKQNKAK